MNGRRGYFPCLSCRTLPGGEHTRDCNLGPGAALLRQMFSWGRRGWNDPGSFSFLSAMETRP